jgi:hypothetical protein
LHLAIVLISVFMLYYGPGLLFRGPGTRVRSIAQTQKLIQ